LLFNYAIIPPEVLYVVVLEFARGVYDAPSVAGLASDIVGCTNDVARRWTVLVLRQNQ